MKFNITYSRYTPESIEAGDAEEHGFLYESLGLVEAMQRFHDLTEGYIEANCYPLTDVRWLSAMGHEDYTTPDRYEYALHIDGCTESTKRRIMRMLGVYGIKP